MACTPVHTSLGRSGCTVERQHGSPHPPLLRTGVRIDVDHGRQEVGVVLAGVAQLPEQGQRVEEELVVHYPGSHCGGLHHARGAWRVGGVPGYAQLVLGGKQPNLSRGGQCDLEYRPAGPSTISSPSSRRPGPHHTLYVGVEGRNTLSLRMVWSQVFSVSTRRTTSDIKSLEASVALRVRTAFLSDEGGVHKRSA